MEGMKREAWPMDDDEGAVDDAANPTTDEISKKRCFRNRDRRCEIDLQTHTHCGGVIDVHKVVIIFNKQCNW